MTYALYSTAAIILLATCISLLLRTRALHKLVKLCVHTSYRLKTVGRLPPHGPALLVVNHISHIDWALLWAASPRPIRFVMFHAYAATPLLHMLYRRAGVIPIASAYVDEQLMQQAFEGIGQALQAGELVCFFPEGHLSKNGKLKPFHSGVEVVARRYDAMVIPCAIEGMWGSSFSHHPRRSWWQSLYRGRRRVTLHVGRPRPPLEACARHLAADVAAMAGVPPPKPQAAFKLPTELKNQKKQQ